MGEGTTEYSSIQAKALRQKTQKSAENIRSCMQFIRHERQEGPGQPPLPGVADCVRRFIFSHLRDTFEWTVGLLPRLRRF